jgi:Flp pilus assembly CpaE family ATPase
MGAVRNTKYFLRMCDVLGYPRSKITFVLNRASTDVGFGVADVERALGADHIFRLGSYGRLLTTSMNVGKPTVIAQPRSAFARAIREIAEHVSQSTDRAK